jgi:hypothetical protein
MFPSTSVFSPGRKGQLGVFDAAYDHGELLLFDQTRTMVERPEEGAHPPPGGGKLVPPATVHLDHQSHIGHKRARGDSGQRSERQEAVHDRRSKRDKALEGGKRPPRDRERLSVALPDAGERLRPSRIGGREHVRVDASFQRLQCRAGPKWGAADAPEVEWTQQAELGA